MSLPKDRDARNALPVWDGCFAYFPDVWAEVAKVSVLGNKQHNLGKTLHWDTTVSTDHANKVIRHMLDDASGEVFDIDGAMHLAKALWRIAAKLQLRCWARDGKDEHGKPTSVTPCPVSPPFGDRLDCTCRPEFLARVTGREFAPGELSSGVRKCPDCGAFGGAHMGSCTGVGI